MQGGVLRTAACAVGAAVALALIAGPAIAVTMNADYDQIDSTQGVFVAHATNPIIGGGPDFTSIYTEAAFCPQPSGCTPGVYTYAASLTPTTPTTEPTTFFTSFPGGIPGLIGLAGWSHHLVDGIAGLTTSIPVTMSLESDGNLTWTVGPSLLNGVPQGSGGGGGLMIFFYQSTDAPGTNMYSVSNQGTGQAAGVAPVPEPASLLLLASSFAGVAIAMRWRGRASVFPRQ